MNSTHTMDDLKSGMNHTADQARSSASRIADEAHLGTQKIIGDAKASGSAIGNEVKNFISDLEEMVSSKTHGVFDVSKIKEDISTRVADYKASLEAASRQVMSDAKVRAEGVNTYVHHEPWKAIGVGFGFGLLLGVVLARR